MPRCTSTFQYAELFGKTIELQRFGDIHKKIDLYPLWRLVQDKKLAISSLGGVTIIWQGINNFCLSVDAIKSRHREDAMNDEILINDAFDSIVDCDERKALLVLKSAEESGMDIVDLFVFGYNPGIDHLGEQFSEGEIVLSKMIASFRILKLVMTEFEKNLR